MQKLGARPSTGTYYIVGKKIIYTMDRPGEEYAMDHFELWPHVVDKLFSNLPPDLQEELKDDAVFGADRGRVVFKGQTTPHGGYVSGSFSLYGTPGSAVYEQRLLKIFGLHPAPRSFTIDIDFKTDPHYKIQPHDAKVLHDIMTMSPNALERRPSEIRIAGKVRMRLTELHIDEE